MAFQYQVAGMPMTSDTFDPCTTAAEVSRQSEDILARGALTQKGDGDARGVLQGCTLRPMRRNSYLHATTGKRPESSLALRSNRRRPKC